jgi:hypothetical protein
VPSVGVQGLTDISAVLTVRATILTSLFSMGILLAQVINRRPLTAEARVRARVVNVGFVVDKVALGQVFLQVLRFPLSMYHPTVALQTHIIWGMNSMSVSGSSSET